MEKKSASEVLREKYEERGWFDINNWSNRENRDIESLTMTEEEYHEFSSLLAELALKDKDEELCEMYFELQRKAVYGNGYAPVQGLEEEEEQMWALGTGEIVDNNKAPRLH